MSYNIVSTKDLTCDLLTRLFTNEVGAVRVPNFISTDVCQLAVQGIQAHGIGYYDGVYPRIGRIGITQNEHKNRPSGKRAYFANASASHNVRERVLQESGDLLFTVMEAVKAAWVNEVGLAFEENLDEYYFAGLVRVINRALLHFDWAQYDGRGWAIEQISAQLSWNIFLQVGAKGGATKIYRRLWQKSDEVYKIPDSYGYDSEVIEQCDVVEILPEQGELVFFNSRNFHEVEKTEGEEERITISSFIGLLEPANKLIFWS